MNEIKDRIKSSVETCNPVLSNSQLNHIDSDDLHDLENIENHTVKKPSIDPMSMSVIVETKSSLQDICDDSLSFETSQNNSPEMPECEKEKKGFWERNFDSLSRLKNKDKKDKKNIDIMSQSLNENMFYNNEQIESEFGSFEKCNNGKSSLNNSKSKITSFSSLSKIMRRDSLGKKTKEISKHSVNDKENVNVNVETPEKCEESSKDSKNTKHRYLKNAKTVTTDNKYVNRSKSNSPESKGKESVNVFENTFPIMDSKNKIFFRKSAGDEIKKTYKSSEDGFIQTAKIPSQDDIDRISRVTLDAPLFSNNGDMNSLGRKTLDSLRELERNRVAMLEQKGIQSN
jgi:pleckstrin homology-like domain family B